MSHVMNVLDCGAAVSCSKIKEEAARAKDSPKPLSLQPLVSLAQRYLDI